ncbi:MAG: hypothetical protein JKY27_04560 [Magnetovibrio sp.]|nr:hypothetical protein [Magnetovibrio sp.]
MSRTTIDHFQTLPQSELEAMRDAGQWVLECHRILHKTSDNIVGEVLRGNGPFIELDHFPPGDVHDAATHSQYYYHAHRTGEHGHFHTFVRGAQAATVQPVAQSQMEYMDERDDTICHLIAISMDNAGFATGLFTTNRWVTAQNWFDANDTVGLLNQFEMDLAPPSWPLNIWMSNMLRLFRPQIIDLIHLRDTTVAAWRTDHLNTDVFEDRGLEITSQTPISVEHQIALINQALA